MDALLRGRGRAGVMAALVAVSPRYSPIHGAWLISPGPWPRAAAPRGDRRAGGGRPALKGQGQSTKPRERGSTRNRASLRPPHTGDRIRSIKRSDHGRTAARVLSTLRPDVPLG